MTEQDQKEAHDKLQQIIGQMMSAEDIMKKAKGEMPMLQKRSRDLIKIAIDAIGGAVLAAWEDEL